MRHALGILGVLAASVLLAVSAAMNYKFGASLGKTELDGQIYGAASAAADCFKALVPFFFFAAIRNRMWSQAAAAAVLGVVVTVYSLASAFGHAAQNRGDVASARGTEQASYRDARTALKRAQDDLGWLPQSRPAVALQAEIDGMKNQRQWSWSKNCTDVQSSKMNRDFCDKYAQALVEQANSVKRAELDKRIAELSAKLDKSNGQSALSEADPQAAALTKLVKLVLPATTLEDVQMALTIFVAILLEVGSGFGMYVAFATWRTHDRAPAQAPVLRAPVLREVDVVASAREVPQVAATKSKLGANDNRALPQLQVRQTAPETDVERYFRERVEKGSDNSTVAHDLYDDYCLWCQENQKEPLAFPTFGRDVTESGVQKMKVGGRIRYIGIGLKNGSEGEEVKKLTISHAA